MPIKTAHSRQLGRGALLLSAALLLCACPPGSDDGITVTLIIADAGADALEGDFGGLDAASGDTVLDQAGSDSDADGLDTTPADAGRDNAGEVDTDDRDDSGTNDATFDGSSDTTSDSDVDADANFGCGEGPMCLPGTACVGGTCVEPVTDLSTYVDDARDHSASLISTLQFPAMFDPPQACCFDLDGDGDVDDALGEIAALLAVLSPDLDLTELFNVAIEDGDFTEIVEWRTLSPSVADLSIFGGLNVPTQDWEARLAGDGSYELNQSSFGDFGAQVQFNNAVVDDGVVYAHPSDFPLQVEVPDLGRLSLTIRNAELELPIRWEANGIHTVDASSANGPIVGGMLGGAVEAVDLLDFLDTAFRSCTCAEVDPLRRVLDWEIGEDVTIACTDNQGTGGSSSCVDTSQLCDNIETFCAIVPGLANGIDLDRDGNGVNESFSIGLRLGLTGAQIVGLNNDVD